MIGCHVISHLNTSNVVYNMEFQLSFPFNMKITQNTSRLSLNNVVVWMIPICSSKGVLTFNSRSHHSHCNASKYTQVIGFSSFSYDPISLACLEYFIFPVLYKYHSYYIPIYRFLQLLLGEMTLRKLMKK